MANYRVITGQFRNFLTDRPFKYGKVNIRLKQNTFTIDAGFPAYNKTVGLDATGHLPVGLELWCNGDGLIPAEYEITEPDGVKWSCTLNEDDGSPISVQALRAGGAVPSNPSTVNSLIASEINSKAVRFDITQTLTTTEKNRVKTALSIPASGGDMYKADYDSDNDGVVDEAELAFEADFADEADHALDSDKLGNVAANLYALETYVDSSVAAKSDIIPIIETVTGTSYTLDAADLGKIKRFTSNSAITLTVPAGLGAGFNCGIIQRGDGQITPTAGVSATVINPLAHTKSIKDGILTIVADSANNFIFQGATE